MASTSKVHKAIALTQPWAILVVLQEKGFETRGRRFNHRGPTWIYATKTMPDYAVRFFEEDPFMRKVRERHRIRSREDLDMGVLLGRTEVLACDPSEEVRQKISDSELAFGNYDDGRYGIRLGHTDRLLDPIEASGLQAMPFDVSHIPGLDAPKFREVSQASAATRLAIGRPPNTEFYRDIDWPEHATHENGQYINDCMDCGVWFIGHKRSPLCRRCWCYRGGQ